MSTDTTAAAELALLAARDRLHALDIPADDFPDDLVPVAVGGSLMPSLPGWTPDRACDWAAVAAQWPEVARRFVAWCEANAGRLANLEVVAAEFSTDPDITNRFQVWMDRRDTDCRLIEVVATVGNNPIDAVEPDLDAALARLNRIPRPWHAELAAAVAAARRGDVEPGLAWAAASNTDPVFYRLTASTELRVLPFAAILAWQSSVNSGPFCGAEAGELRLATSRTERLSEGDRPRSRLEYGFDFRPGLPWGRRLRLDRGHAEARDPAGNPAYEPADFFELP